MPFAECSPRPRTVPALVLGLALAALPPRAVPAASVPPGAGGPLWPLEVAPRYLTSGFMEYREGRFHAGIDLKTMGRCGFAVRAAEDGQIELLRASPTGYGRSVLLRGRSGRRYLYAHLERFADRLRAPVAAAQREQGRYGLQVAPEPGALVVARGEVLGLSGQSGTLGPHLHLEVRNAAGDALDPLRHGFAVPDTIPPRVLRVIALPAAPSARVEGGVGARSLADTAGLPGVLPPLRVSGPVAFAAEFEERADRMHHRLAPARVEVRCDGATVFAAVNDSFPLARQDLRRLEWLDCGTRRAQWLWRRPGNDLPGRHGADWSLAEGGLAPGPHTVTVTAADAAGNVATVTWIVEAAAAPAAGDTAAWPEDPQAEVALPTADGDEAWSVTPLLLLARRPAGVRAWTLSDADGGAVPPGWERVVLGPVVGGTPSVPAILFCAPDSLSPAQAREARERQGLVALGPAARLLAADWPVAGRPAVPWPGGGPPAAVAEPAVAAYSAEGDGGWRLAASLEPPAGAGGAWRLPVAGPGRYALLRDVQPPRLGGGPADGCVRRAPRSAVPGVAGPRWEALEIALTDAGSGVDPAAVTARLDGRPLVVEPDPLHDRVLVELPDSLGAGPHELRLRAADRAGLVTRRRIALRLVAGS